MDAERARQMMLQLPHVCETLQWGDNLVFWVGDKACGGKMFALIDLSGVHSLAISFAAGPQRSQELLEMEGFRPAPYLARAHWIGAETWDVFSTAGWRAELAQAHAYVYGRMPAKVRAKLASST